MKNVDDLFPLTPVQELMLLHERAGGPGNTLANQVVYDFVGPLRESPLREAARALVARHPALRTAVLDDARLERPLQVVRTSVEVPFETVDLTGRTPDAREGELERIRADDAGRRFDLGRAPLVRFTLVTLAPDRHRLLWTLHHLVADRWAFSVAAAELALLYGERVGGAPAALPEPVPFRRYVAWLGQRDPVATDAFWAEELSAVDRPTLLTASGRPRSGARLRTRHRIDGAETARIDAIARTRRVSASTALLGAVGLAAGRRAGTAAPLVGLTVSGRPPDIDGVEHIVGSFVNGVPTVVSLDGGASVGEWLRGLQRRAARRLPHEHLGLNRILDRAGLDGGPWFDLLVVLNLDTPPAPAWQELDVSVAGATLEAGFPLVLQVARADDGLELTLVHDEGALDAEAFLGEVAGALRTLVDADPESSLASVADVPARAASAPGRRAEPSPAADADPIDRSAAVRAIWCEILGVDDPRRDDDFFALGGTSLQGARLLSRLEALAGRPVPMAALVSGRTLGALIDAVVPAEAPGPTGPLLVLRPEGDRPPLVGVPGLRGNLILFVPLVDHLAPGRPIHGLQSRGTDRDETRLRSMEAMAADYVEQLGDMVRGPFHLFGLCWGAAAAFEMTAQLIARGTPPLSLSLLDPAVLLGRDDRRRADRDGGTVGFVRDRLGLYWDEFRSRGWKERGRLVAEKAGRFVEIVGSGGSEALPKQELRQRAVIEANLRALEKYDPPLVDIEARLFLSADFDVEGRPDPRREWVAQFRRAPSIVPVPGFDSGDAVKTHTAAVAAALDAWMEERDSPS